MSDVAAVLFSSMVIMTLISPRESGEAFGKFMTEFNQGYSKTYIAKGE